MRLIISEKIGIAELTSSREEPIHDCKYNRACRVRCAKHSEDEGASHNGNRANRGEGTKGVCE